MATLQAARNLEMTKKRAADEAPKHHVKKPKQTISVAGLFAKKPRTVREDLQSTDGTSRKRLGAEDEMTARAKRHPIYLDVKEATAAYAQGDISSVGEEIDAIHDELTARIESIDINRKPPNCAVTTTHLATQDTKDDPALFRPLREDVVTVSVNKPDGSLSLKHVVLGDSMQRMAKLIDDTEAKVTRLKEELEEVSEDISSVLSEYNKVTKSVCKVHEAKREVFLSDVHTYHESTIDNIVKARMEDQKHSVDANRKLQAFAASLI